MSRMWANEGERTDGFVAREEATIARYMRRKAIDEAVRRIYLRNPHMVRLLGPGADRFIPMTEALAVLDIIRIEFRKILKEQTA